MLNRKTFHYTSRIMKSVTNLKHFSHLRACSSKIDLLYDSKCPLCDIEVKFLRKHDVNGNIQFTDISALDYDPKEHGNVSFEDGMKKLHAVLPDKSTVSGVEVVRRIYSEVGLGWIFSFTKLPIIGRITDHVYDIWAEYRLKLTGRPQLADILQERSEKLKNLQNHNTTN